LASAVTDPLLDPAVVEDPYGYYAQLRDADPVHELPGAGTFLVTRMELIHEVVAKPLVYSSVSSRFLHHRANDGAPGLRGVSADSDIDTSQGSVLATADPPDHTRQRRVVTRGLSTVVMQEMEPEFRELVDRVLDDALATGNIEWMSQLAEPLPMIMVARILGLDDSAAPALKEQGYASVEAISGFVTDERVAELGAPMMNVGPVVDAYFAMRATKQYDADTLIGVCGQAVDAGELTDIEALATLFLLVSAGGESTTSLTGTGVRILAERPDLQDRLRNEPHLIPAFVEEACRIDPPFRGHYRHVVSDTVLGGVPLPAGSTLVLAWPAATETAPPSSTPTRSTSTAPTRAGMSVSVGASTSAWARHWHASKPRWRSNSCSGVRRRSASARPRRRCTITKASWSGASSSFRFASKPQNE
jgi:cytochrome P450 family 144